MSGVVQCQCDRIAIPKLSGRAFALTSDVPGRSHDEREDGERGQQLHHRSRGPPRQPECERDEEERRQGGQVAAQEVRCEPGGEEPDLGRHQHHDRGGHGDERPRARITLAAAERLDQQEDERGERREGGGEGQIRKVVVRQPQPCADRIRAADRDRIRPEEPGEGRADGGPGNGDRPDRPERAELRPVPREHRVEQDRRDECGDERDGLDACEHGRGDQRQRDRLRAKRGRLDGARDREQGERREWIEERLGHDEARVEEERRGDRERRGHQRVGSRHQLAAVRDERHGDERRADRLDDLQRREPGRRLADRQRQTDERGVEDAVAGELPVERQGAVLPQREPA